MFEPVCKSNQAEPVSSMSRPCTVLHVLIQPSVFTLGARGQESLLIETFKVVPKALEKQILFIFELGVETGFVHPGRLFQFVKTGVSKPVTQKTGAPFSRHHSG